MRTLVVNAGSSSLKLAVLEDGRTLADATVERWEGQGHLDPVREFVEEVDDLEAVGHRVVHGGQRFTAPVRIDEEVVDHLVSITDLAPLHNPRAVAGIRAVQEVLPDLPAVACFDTTFHATLSPAARTYALPREWNERWGLRRFGFHGLSHEYAVRRAAEIVDQPLEDLRVVSCHLGSGASLAAVREGSSVDTTMGFTPLAGLVMATRSGTLDPGLVLWLQEHGGIGIDELSRRLESEAGMKGLSGTSGDLRDVLAGRADGDDGCALAFDVFVHVLRREIGAMAASARGVDLLVMTGGIGEHSPEVRMSVCGALGHLGVAVDPVLNEETTADEDISARDAKARTVVVSASEESQIARETEELLSRGP